MSRSFDLRGLDSRKYLETLFAANTLCRRIERQKKNIFCVCLTRTVSLSLFAKPAQFVRTTAPINFLIIETNVAGGIGLEKRRHLFARVCHVEKRHVLKTRNVFPALTD